MTMNIQHSTVSICRVISKLNIFTTGRSDKLVSLVIQHDKAEYILCTLVPGTCYQQALDLNFTEGEEVTFFTNGSGMYVLL